MKKELQSIKKIKKLAFIIQKKKKKIKKMEEKKGMNIFKPQNDNRIYKLICLENKL